MVADSSIVTTLEKTMDNVSVFRANSFVMSGIIKRWTWASRMKVKNEERSFRAADPLASFSKQLSSEKVSKIHNYTLKFTDFAFHSQKATDLLLQLFVGLK